MSWRAFRVRDDRGAWRDVPYRVGSEVWSSLSAGERRGLDAARDLQWLKRLIASPWLLISSWLALGLSLVITIAFIRSPEVLDFITLLVLVVFVAATLLWAVGYRRLLGRLLDKCATALHDEMPMCASCGYCLAGLAPEGDACVVCPECGAAWRLAKTEPP